MTQETTIQISPIDVARGNIESALSGIEFNGTRIMSGLDGLEHALHEAGTRPVDIFTELASHASSARNMAVRVNDLLQGHALEQRANNYLRTAQMFAESTPATSAPGDALTAGQEATISKPSNTSTLKGTGSAKSI